MPAGICIYSIYYNGIRDGAVVMRKSGKKNLTFGALPRFQPRFFFRTYKVFFTRQTSRSFLSTISMLN